MSYAIIKLEADPIAANPNMVRMTLEFGPRTAKGLKGLSAAQKAALTMLDRSGMAELLASSPQGAKALAEAHGLPWPADEEASESETNY